MHSLFSWACCAATVGICLAVVRWQQLVYVLVMLGVLVALLLLCGGHYARQAWRQHAVDQELRGQWQARRWSRVSVNTVLLPAVAALCLGGGYFFGVASLQNRMSSAAPLLATTSVGAVLCQGALAGPIEVQHARLEGAFRVSAIYAAYGLRALSGTPTVWLSIALPKTAPTASGSTVIRAYATARQLISGTWITDYIHFSRVKPGPFATALRRRGILMSGASSLYGVTIVPRPAALDIWSLYGRLLNAWEASAARAYGNAAASWLLAIGLGDHAKLEAQVITTLAGLGAVHALIASGATINMTVAPLVRRLRGLGQERVPVWYGTGALLLFALLLCTGFALPALRAAIVYLYCLTGDALGMRTRRVTANAVAAIGIALWQPDAAWDPGVLLSFAAAAVLGPLGRSLMTLFGRWQIPLRVRSILARGLAAQFGVTPLIALFFDQFSLVSLLVNLFLYPLLEAAIPVSLVLLLGSFFPWPGQSAVRFALTALANTVSGFVIRLQHVPLVLHLPPVTYVEILIYFTALSFTLYVTHKYAARPRSQYL